MNNITLELILFTYSILIGIYLGVSYELLHMLILKHLNKLVKFIIDILFFVLQGFLVFRVLFNINYGIIPLYSYFLFLVGFLIYQQFSSKTYQKQLKQFEKMCVYIYIKIRKLFYFLVIEPFEYLLVTGQYLYNKLSQIFLFIAKKIKNFIKKRFKWKIKIRFRKKKKNT